MDNFEEKLNRILSNPEAMGQIMNLAQSLGGGESGGAQAPPPSPPPPSSPPSPPLPQPPPSGSSGGLGDLLGQIDPKLISKLLPLFQELTGNRNGERMQLLYALRPFLRKDRQAKVEQAARAAHLICVGKKLLGAMGENHV